jgi:hypothetical protein
MKGIRGLDNNYDYEPYLFYGIFWAIGIMLFGVMIMNILKGG